MRHPGGDGAFGVSRASETTRRRPRRRGRRRTGPGADGRHARRCRTTARRILVTGASIAGNAVAACLGRHGFDVTFAGGRTERHDAVIVAEGVGSGTRERVFPAENAPRWMNLTVAYFTIPRTPTDDRIWRWYNATGGRSVSLRPDRHGTTRAMLMLQPPPGGEQDWDAPRQKAYLLGRFADAGWEAPRVLAAMEDTDDFYLDVLRQVRMPRLSRGRVVLTGDAAWCVTLFGGIGTTLAVTGAYVLAAELARAGAFAA